MDNSGLKDYEARANRFSVRCQCLMLVFPLLTWIMNLLNIFIVDPDLMTVSVVGSVIISVATICLCNLIGMENPVTKYFALFGIVAAICLLACTLTYHIYILMVLPIIFAVQYGMRSMVFYTYGLSVISTTVSVYVGYYFGLCDANMVTLTSGRIGEYVNPATGMFMETVANTNPAYTLFMYFVVPRCMIQLAILLMVVHISDMIANRAVREEQLKRMSETDDMTGLYNKNKYLFMVKSHYPHVEKVAVIFWDVNGLKETNDTLGHRFGDRLIKNIALSIEEAVDDKGYIFRIGGDEFIAIIENMQDEDIETMIEQWKKCILIMNESVGGMELSASVGYASGFGRNIESIVDAADGNMYSQKKSLKKRREDKG